MMSGSVRGAWERVHWIPVSPSGSVDYRRKQTSWHLAVAANIRIVNKHLSFTTAVNVLEIAGPGVCLQWASRITRKTCVVAGRHWWEITKLEKRFEIFRFWCMPLFLYVLMFSVRQQWGNLEVELEIIQRRQVHVQNGHSQNTLTAALLRLMDYVIDVFCSRIAHSGLVWSSFSPVVCWDDWIVFKYINWAQFLSGVNQPDQRV